MAATTTPARKNTTAAAGKDIGDDLGPAPPEI